MEHHLLINLGMDPTIGDSAQNVKRSCYRLARLCGCHEDDSSNANTDEFQTLTKFILMQFESEPRLYYMLDFYGTQIKTIAPNNFVVSQR